MDKFRKVVSYVVLFLLIGMFWDWGISIVSVIENGLNFTAGETIFDKLFENCLYYWFLMAVLSFAVWMHPDWHSERGFFACLKNMFTFNGMNLIVSIIINVIFSPFLMIYLAFRTLQFAFCAIKGDFFDGRGGGRKSSGSTRSSSSTRAPARRSSGSNFSAFASNAESLLRGNMDSGRDLLVSGGTYCKRVTFEGYSVKVSPSGRIDVTGTIKYQLNKGAIISSLNNGYSESHINSAIDRDMQNIVDKAAQRAIRSAEKIIPDLMDRYNVDVDVTINPSINIRSVE